MNAFEFIICDPKIYKINDDNDYVIDVDKLSALIDEAEFSIMTCSYVHFDMLHKLASEIYPQFIIKKEIADKLKSIEIITDKTVADYYTSVKYPYYRLRGKKISEEQAAEITDCNISFYTISCKKTAVPNGIVGINNTLYKFPNIAELTADMIMLKLNFPYLDFIMAVTDWDSIPHTAYEKKDFFISEYNYEKDEINEFEDFEKFIEIGVYVHDNLIEFLSPERTIELYNEYAKIYTRDEMKFFFRDTIEIIET